MSEISLLPEDMRGKEEEVREGKPAEKIIQEGGLAMHIPDAAVDEDIEIIEVDEGDLAAILSDEPFMTRFTYQLSVAIDKLKDRLFKKEDEALPAKLPPQFFKPPKSGLVTKALPSDSGSGPGRKPPLSETGAPTGASKARIIPEEGVQRRVRVIRRVKKPVRVSLISAEELASLSIDVGKRKWTFAVVAFVFAAIIGAGYFLITQQMNASRTRLADLQRQLDETRAANDERQETWSQYEDLEDRLTALDGVLEDHIVISRVFDFLELRTLPNVSYRTAAWSSEGELILDVLADSFDSAARQLIAFEQSDTVVSVDATSFSAQESGEGEAAEVSFQLIIELDAKSFQGPLLVQDSMEDASMEGGVEASVTSTAYVYE